jgi:hypothetical protein
MKRFLCLMAVLAWALSAAGPQGSGPKDISGNWKATADFGNGPMERTFTFKVDGARLTGETNSSMMGKSEIVDGKVDGDNVTFTITVKFQDNEMKLNYKGKVNGSGDGIKFTVDGAQGQTIVWDARKVK